MKKPLVFASVVALLAASATGWALNDRDKPAPAPPMGVPGGAPGFVGQPPGVGGPQPPMGFIGGPGGLPGRTDYKELVPALIDTLGDADSDVRKNVAHSLARIGQPAVTPLLDILKDKEKSKELKANAAYVLGKIGPSAREALPALTRALKDHDRDLRRRAAFAIAHIVSNDFQGFPPGMFPGGMRPGMGGTTADAGIADPGLLEGRVEKPKDEKKGSAAPKDEGKKDSIEKKR